LPPILPDGQITSTVRPHASPAPRVKIFGFRRRANHRYRFAHPVPQEGRIMIVADVGMGCGGRGSVARKTESQGGSSRERVQMRKTNNAAAYGKTVWSWHPLLVSSWRRRVVPTGCEHVANSSTTVTRRIRRRGEQGISRKAIAQGMSDCLRCPVCSCAHLFVHIAHETAGAARIRHSLRPLTTEGGRFLAKARARIAPRDRERLSKIL
jgi:hypothetical protein